MYVEILDQNGNNVDVIMNAVCEAGYHLATWNAGRFNPGRYQYRVRYNDFNEVKDIVLNRA